MNVLEEKSKSAEQGRTIKIFGEMDPTVLVKLHAILSNKDVYILYRENDYKVKCEANNLASMNIPADMRGKLKDMSLDSLSEITEKWHNTDEVKMYNWSYLHTKNNLLNLINLAQKGELDEKIIFLL